MIAGRPMKQAYINDVARQRKRRHCCPWHAALGAAIRVEPPHKHGSAWIERYTKRERRIRCRALRCDELPTDWDAAEKSEFIKVADACVTVRVGRYPVSSGRSVGEGRY